MLSDIFHVFMNFPKKIDCFLWGFIFEKILWNTLLSAYGLQMKLKWSVGNVRKIKAIYMQLKYNVRNFKACFDVAFWLLVMG